MLKPKLPSRGAYVVVAALFVLVCTLRPLYSAPDAASPSVAELSAMYDELMARSVAQHAELSKLSARLNWLSTHVYRAGVIVPFYGTVNEASALSGEGWIICDGRIIQDDLAVPRFKGKTTPNLTERFLKGANGNAQSTGGDKKPKTSTDGLHAHKLPKIWYHKDFAIGTHRSIDTFNPITDDTSVEEDGLHFHTVDVDPPHLNCIFLIYVREHFAEAQVKPLGK